MAEFRSTVPSVADTPATINEELTQQHRSAPMQKPPVLLLFSALAVAMLSLVPVTYLFVREGLSLSRLQIMLQSPSTSMLLRNTLSLVLWVTLGTIVLGVVLATIVVATDIPFRRFWMIAFTLPLGIPTFVTSYTWVAAGYEFFPKSTFIYGIRGVALILILSLYPYIYLPTLASLRQLDTSQEWVARALGKGPFIAFLQVTLPQLRRAISGGALIVALHMLAEFGALELLRYQTLTTAIMQRATVLGSPEAARSLSVLLAALALVLIIGDLLLFRTSSTPVRIGGGVAQKRVPWRLGWWGIIPSLFALLVVVVALGIPLYGMIRGAVRISLGQASIDWASLRATTFTTAEYALWTAVVIAVVAIPISLLIARWPSPRTIAIERAAWIAHSLPGVVVALGMIYFGVRWLHPFYQTSILLVAGYAVLYLPIAIGAQRVGFEHASENYELISRSLGRGPLRTFGSVTLPLAMPGIVVGMMLVMLNVSKELTMTLLLRPTGQHTLASKLWTTTEGEVLDFTAAAPYAITIVLLMAIPTWLLIRSNLNPASASN